MKPIGNEQQAANAMAAAPPAVKTLQPLRMLALAAMLLPAMSAAVLAEPAGTVKTAKGTATIERGGKALPASVGTAVEAQDRILTGADGAVGITLRDNTMLSAGPGSVLELRKFSFDSTTHAGALDASVRKGTLAVISGKLAKASPGTVAYSTPNATLGVRGTEFVIEVGEEAK